MKRGTPWSEKSRGQNRYTNTIFSIFWNSKSINRSMETIYERFEQDAKFGKTNSTVDLQNIV